MKFRRIVVIMAGGSGERFWPLSRKLRPKQLLRLAHPDKTLLAQTVERLEPLVGLNQILIATAPHLVGPSRQAVCSLPEKNVIAEPHKRNTAGCLVWLAANLLAEDPDARENVSMAVVAADHKIAPDEGFQATVNAALDVAEQTGGLVTIGIRPTRPETGYGYIEVSEESGALGTARVPVKSVKRFREKPTSAEAEEFLGQKNFLWNSGMFFWRLDAFLRELEQADPVLYGAVFEIAELLRQGKREEADRAFEGLHSISIDFALMEKARQVFVAEAAFDWDDVGSWDALDRSLTPDESRNVSQGQVTLVDVRNSIVVNDSKSLVTCLLGVDGIAVVVTDDAVLVCAKDRAQEVRKVVESLKEAGIERI